MKVTANATRSGRWWAIEVPEINNGIYTQAKRIDEIPAMVADAVSLVTDTPADTIEVEVQLKLPDALDRNVTQARHAVAALDAQQRETAKLSRAAVKSLLDAGFSGVDTAEILGVTPQRISQLRKAS